MTYEVGMRSQRLEACGTTLRNDDVELTATKLEKTLQVDSKGILPNQKTDNPPFEACYWTIEIEPLTWVVDESNISLTVSSTSSTFMAVAAGSSRSNSTWVQASEDDTFTVSVTEKVILIMSRTSSDGASFNATYQVIGEEYPAWEKPFLGEEPWVF